MDLPPGVQTGLANPEQAWLATPAPPLPHVDVQWDGDEPFLPVRADVTITPFRDTEDDVQNLTELLNHPLVGKYSFDRPYPYTTTAARNKISSSLPSTEAMAALRGGVVETCPFHAIRINGKLVGDINVWWRPDGRGILGLTYDLHPDYHRRGIGGAAVRTLLGWCARGMEASKVEAYTEDSNEGSGALLSRVGFSEVGSLTLPWPEQSGGGTRTLIVWQRGLPDPAPWVATPSSSPPMPKIVWGEEPYIDLGDVTITPFRDTPDEIAQLVELSNAPEVARWTYTRPTPYLPSHARDKLDKSIPLQRTALEQLRDGKVPCTLPFTVIRDSTGRYVGDMALYSVPYCPDRLELSYVLHPEFHGRGIGKRAAAAILGFAPRMECSRIQAYTQTINVVSGKLLEKLGFEIGEIRWYKWKEGGCREVKIWERELGQPEST